MSSNNSSRLRKRKPRGKLTVCSVTNLRRSSRIAELNRRFEEARNITVGKYTAQCNSLESKDSTLKKPYFKVVKISNKNKDVLGTQSSCVNNTSVKLKESSGKELLGRKSYYGFSWNEPTSNCTSSTSFVTHLTESTESTESSESNSDEDSTDCC